MTSDELSDKLTTGNNAPANNMSKDEQIGFHKGSINVLIAERNELLRMVSITEQLVNTHASELAKLGVNINQDK